jgi:hypothetical protein
MLRFPTEALAAGGSVQNGEILCALAPTGFMH